MTTHGQIPTRANRREWTTYERQHATPTSAFDFDACSARHAPQAEPGIRDVEDLTLLSGLESIASESDTR